MTKRCTKQERPDLAEHLTNFDRLPDSALIRTATVQALFGAIQTPCMLRYIEQGVIPRPFKLKGSAINFWRAGEIRKALLSQGD